MSKKNYDTDIRHINGDIVYLKERLKLIDHLDKVVTDFARALKELSLRVDDLEYTAEAKDKPAKRKRSGWINIYPGGYTEGPVYPTQAAAKQRGVDIVATIQIEWEE